MVSCINSGYEFFFFNIFVTREEIYSLGGILENTLVTSNDTTFTYSGIL